MGNVRYPQLRTKQSRTYDQTKGFRLGVLAAATVFIDKYDVSKEEAEELIKEAYGFVVDYGDGKINIKQVFYELQRKTGLALEEYIP
jgi:hypothetical protein